MAQDVDIARPTVSTLEIHRESPPDLILLIDKVIALLVVHAARIARSTPIFATTSLATPRISIICPPVRRYGARSTTIDRMPARPSQ